MERKLQCILVDDDLYIHDVFREYLKGNEFAEVTDYYEDPTEFINANKKPDLVFLDIMMPKIDGLRLASMIKPTPVILFTSNTERFGDIMNMMEAIDAFPKPILKERLLKSVEKAYFLLNSNKPQKRSETFNTDTGKATIILSDLLFVRTIKNTHRHLEAYLQGGQKIILKGYSLGKIHKKAGFLLQSNRAELVSPYAIMEIERNTLIKLIGVKDNGVPINSTLCRSFKKKFLYRYNSVKE